MRPPRRGAAVYWHRAGIAGVRYGGLVTGQEKDRHSATIRQLTTALAALGVYRGTNTAAERAALAAEHGGAEAYRA